ncbi:Putative uncharacterized protein [Taphrina deformans PYCC 5710]|uniref:Asl1-like glycosyl hydrolase catalytic domain-containing protein n=1 Tax=Taphrina deformans (strain PYCC 5710 / ATCC 11124 / CBS 356.35 / IMI 108563 / JCM 9778 / NBRC 8474) TaxID=1097556 RepID=R4X6X6_TAPDE|nr:Putative uncharacterized protein [Taphrina deformans PYCC 5710]|eukprot:CCG80982.1 Putative uncharacterized protein [Taphrina deformans PYCC 5710]
MLSALVIVLEAVQAVSAVAGKRGLIGVDNIHSKGDQPTLIKSNATTWAYNYGTQPGNSTWFGNLEFIPQLWGGNNAATFMSEVLANNPATTHVLTFNEPDGQGGGQATMTPALAATIWKQYVEPLKAHNISLGSPACTGTDSGIQWLKQFMGNCSTCHVDFIATHWYGDFSGLSSHLGQLYNTFNGSKIWVTELGIDSATLSETQSTFDTSIAWLDDLSWVDRYAWFGGFRSIDSNIGPNATFLDANGGLTKIGTEYLYTNQTIKTPAAAATTTRLSATATATTTSSANIMSSSLVLSLVVAAISGHFSL